MPGSQTNTVAASLTLSGVIPALSLPGAFPILGPTQSSTTLVWVSAGGPFPPNPFTLSGTIDGAAGMPIIVAASLSQSPSNSCSVSAGPGPCPPGPILLASGTTPFGLYHGTPTPIFLLDGVNGTAPLAFTDSTGSFAVGGTFDIGGGAPATTTHKSFQALVGDPTSSSGYRMTAAFTVADWIVFP